MTFGERTGKAPTLADAVSHLRCHGTVAGGRRRGLPNGVMHCVALATHYRTGRPHFVVVDEAHHMLPATWDPGATALPGGFKGFLFVTVRPEALSPRTLDCVDRVLAVGAEARYSHIELDDRVTRGRSAANTGGVYGGGQDNYAVGVNWCPNDHLRLMLGYDIINVDRLNAAGTTQVGQQIQAAVLWAQAAF